MRWTRQRFARDGIAGRLERLVSDQRACGREMLLRTAKSCGPDAPTLASSSRSCVGPTGLRQNISADDGVLVYSCAFYQCKARTRLRVQRAPGVPHALFGRKINANLGCFVLRDRETAFVVGAGTRNACPGCCAARRTCGVVRC